MTELVLSVVLGIVFFLVFLILAFKGQPKVIVDASTMTAFQRIVDLQGLSCTSVDLLLAPGDYQMLRSRAGLRTLARQLRDDRRRIVLSWLDSLQEDLGTLWRFRRFLVRNGVSVTFREEIHIASTAMLALFSLLYLRVLVSFAGPFAVRSSLFAARYPVERASQLCANLLSRLPATNRQEVEQKWIKGVA